MVVQQKTQAFGINKNYDDKNMIPDIKELSGKKKPDRSHESPSEDFN